MSWTIKVLVYGTIESNTSKLCSGFYSGLKGYSPYLGFLLQKDGQNVLVDTGIHERFIVDGKAWGGNKAEGGCGHVLDALKKEGLTPKDIDMVLYTHLHNDHTGACEYFMDALNVFQKDEWLNLLNPLPSQQVRGDYDMQIIDTFRKMKNVSMVRGDVKLSNGLKLIQTPGHTLGSMSILVPTDNGMRAIVGDLFHTSLFFNPQMDEHVCMDGSIIKIDPATKQPESYGPIIVHSIVYDHYAYYDSYYKIKALVPEMTNKYVLCGHEQALVYGGVQ
jgi:N-acyl homoserine lactone hydrolase